VFIGWYTAANSGGTEITASHTVSDTITKLYALWISLNDKVQLWENGPYWATTNIGAEKPWESGYYFWWGDTIGYKHENGKWVASDRSSLNYSFVRNTSKVPTVNLSISELQSKGWITSEGILSSKHDAAHVQWGGNWRMPTDQELSSLKVRCEWLWMTINGVKGHLVLGKGVYSSAGIFLPCTGAVEETSIHSADYGYYWSSVPKALGYAGWLLQFSSSWSGVIGVDHKRWWGQAIRPLQ
jgi:hypothetical protein